MMVKVNVGGVSTSFSRFYYMDSIQGWKISRNLWICGKFAQANVISRLLSWSKS